MTLVWRTTFPRLCGLSWAFHGSSGPHPLDNVMNLGAVCPLTRVPRMSQVTYTSKRAVCGSAWIGLLKVRPPIDAGTLLSTGGGSSRTYYIQSSTSGHRIGWKCGRHGLAAHLWLLTWFACWSTSTRRLNVCYASTTLRQTARFRPPFLPIRSTSDTDCYPIKINNCCTASITNDLKDVAGKPVPIASRIVRFTGGQTLAVFRCTLQWDIEDDEGVSHKILLPN